MGGSKGERGLCGRSKFTSEDDLAVTRVVCGSGECPFSCLDRSGDEDDVMLLYVQSERLSCETKPRIVVAQNILREVFGGMEGLAPSVVFQHENCTLFFSALEA